MPFEIVEKTLTADEIGHYDFTARMEWRPEGVVLHNTDKPSLAQWSAFVKDERTLKQRIANFKHDFENLRRWSSGPHMFISPDGIHLFSPLWRPGRHSPTWNKSHFGVELIGNYDVEMLPSKLRTSTIAALAALYQLMGIKANESNFRYHKEDPATSHKNCPGVNIGSKADWIREANTFRSYTPARATAEPPWIVEGMKHIGLSEIHGSQHNPAILRWWSLIRAPFTDDETPWCAGYVGGVLESVGIQSTRSAWARSYLNWDVRLNHPVKGCVVVFERGPQSGHVGFAVGRDSRGNLMVLGGNQGDVVSIKPFPLSRVLGYRWPKERPVPLYKTLAVIASDGALSTNEA